MEIGLIVYNAEHAAQTHILKFTQCIHAWFLLNASCSPMLSARSQWMLYACWIATYPANNRGQVKRTDQHLWRNVLEYLFSVSVRVRAGFILSGELLRSFHLIQQWHLFFQCVSIFCCNNYNLNKSDTFFVVCTLGARQVQHGTLLLIVPP